MNRDKKMKIVLSNRNTKEYLILAINSIKKNQYYDNDIVVYDDNSTDGSREWLKDNKDKLGIDVVLIDGVWREGETRLGITGVYNQAMKDHTEEHIPVMLGHTDMVYGEMFDKNILRHSKEGVICCSTRIEPPIVPEQPKVKLIQDFGLYPNEFKEEDFNDFVSDYISNNSGKVSDGTFAPMLVFKSDWDSVGGIPNQFAPQSREDSVIQYAWKIEKKDFVQAWDSLVYHFSGRGSRKKERHDSDSQEWIHSNSKNLINFQRLFKESPVYTETQHPNPPSMVCKLALGILTKNNEMTIFDTLVKHEPFFDEFIIVDDNSKDRTKQEVDSFKD